MMVENGEGRSVMQEQIVREISKNLTDEMRETALKFTAFLKSHGLMFHRDRSGDWAEKIYYWARSDKNCVCFIAVKDPDEPENAWTVWSDDSAAYEAPLGDAETSEIGLKYVNRCEKCGACGGGRVKTVFGKRISGVCMCTFRVDNADLNGLPFLKTMVELRLNEILQP